VAWLYLVAAILLEVCGTTSMKLSRSFTVPRADRGDLRLLRREHLLLDARVRRLEIGVAYAIWSALGTAIVATIGIVWFRRVATLAKLASLVLVRRRRGRSPALFGHPVAPSDDAGSGRGVDASGG